MSLYSEELEFQKELEAYREAIRKAFEYVEKECEKYMTKLVCEWVDKELKKMGYSAKDKKED